MVDSSFKIVNTFTMLAGEGRMMTEGKGEWTEPEEINEKVKLGWWTSHLLVFGIHSKKKKKNPCNGCNFFICWVYTQLLEVRI